MRNARGRFAARLTILLALPAAPAFASNHLVQIHKVIGGVNGDTEFQAIQFRMREANQNQFQHSRVWVYDANGENPVLIVDFDRSVRNGNLGDTVLVASPRFGEVTTPTARPDFVMTNLIPASYLPAGSLTLEDNAGTNVWWRLSWGGENYTGPTTGSTANDPDGEFGPPVQFALPSNRTTAIEFVGPASAMSSSNIQDYVETAPTPPFTNNAGETFTISDCRGFICHDMNCDGLVNGGDIDPFFQALGDPAAWQAAHPNCPLLCVGDINGDGRVDGGDIDPFFVGFGHPCR
ncbi:MAG: hypothetical protein IH986_15560 [Planctomycetes bacterium]|nr:hypothetical protein [Planctomycetota bacterium]